MWKYYQNKNKTSQLNTPAHLILSPNDTNSSYNNIDFSTVGNSVSQDANAFAKIKKFSKLTTTSTPVDTTNTNSVFKKLSNLYLDANTHDNTATTFGTTRQHNLSSLNTLLPSFSTLVDTNSFNKFSKYYLHLNCNTEHQPLVGLADLLYGNITNHNNDFIYRINLSNLLSLKKTLEQSNDPRYSYFFKRFRKQFKRTIFDNFNTSHVNSDKKNLINVFKLLAKTNWGGFNKKLFQPSMSKALLPYITPRASKNYFS